jgi:hypothetical protein
MEPALSLIASDSDLLAGNIAEIDWAAANIKNCRGTVGFPEALATAGSANEYNKLSNRRYLRFDGDGTTRRYTVSAPTNSIPVFVVARTNGSLAGGYAKGVRNIFVDQAIPPEGSWGWVGECSVVLSSIAETTRSECSATTYTAPAEQCFTITAAPAPAPTP